MKNLFIRVVPLFFMVIVCVSSLFAQADRAQSKVDIVQRYDIRRSVDGKYAGLFYGYSKATWFLMFPAPDGSIPVEARWYLTGESLNDVGRTEKPLSDELSATFRWLPDGSIIMNSRGPAPFVRGFPAPPPPGVQPGQYWDTPATLSVDPDGSGKWTTVKAYVRHTLQGYAEYNGKRVLDVRAKYAIRYKEGDDLQGNPALKLAEGSHEATIYLNPDTLFPVFIREQVINENWVFKDGKRIKNDGFILWFFEGGVLQTGSAKIAGTPTVPPVAQLSTTTIPRAVATQESTSTTLNAITSVSTVPPIAVATTSTIPAIVILSPTTTTLPPSVASLMHAQTEKIRHDLEEQNIEGVNVRPDPRGTALTLENLRFVADSAELLPGENTRLDRIAGILKTIAAEKSFLIRGHSAKAGTEAGQLALSKDRAKRIMSALVQRGIAPGRFYWEGKGSTEPIADNNTEEGKAKNRRVEIIILE